MRGFDWHGLWMPRWPPWEVTFRATFIYFFATALFRLVGRKEISGYAMPDIVLLFLIAVATRESMVGTDSSLTSAAVALGTIVGWDWLASHATFRSRRLAKVIDGPVQPLVVDGEVNEDELKRARISREELRALLRRRGRRDLEEVKEAYLERSGTVTFIVAPKNK